MDSIEDLSGSANAIGLWVRKSFLFFLLLMGLLGGVLFLAGLVQLRVTDPGALDRVPEPVFLIALGLVSSSLWFPLFISAFFARHLLFRLERLEHEAAARADRPLPSIDGS